MTLLNIANDGLYNVLIVLCKTVSQEGPIDRDKLAEICSIKEKDSEVKIRQTLHRWTQLGLFLDHSDKLTLCSSAAKKLKGCKTPEEVTRTLPSILREIVFKEENNNNFWDREETRASDLNRALAWILAQNIYTFSISTRAESEAVEQKQLSDPGKRILQNDVRFNGLRFWAQFLGFTWRSRVTMVDPTQAVKEECRALFTMGKDYQAGKFIEALATRIPVIDGGTYRQSVEGILDQQHWQKPSNEQMLSTSLSRALWRLELAGIIDLESRADAQSNRVLQRQQGLELRSFTHVLYRGEEQ